VSEFHHFNWQCAMRLHPAFAPRIWRVEAVAASRLPLPRAVAAVQVVAGPGPAFDPSCFVAFSHCCSYTHATLQVAYMLEQELAWRSSVLRVLTTTCAQCN
jgi:hypothetical protein